MAVTHREPPTPIAKWSAAFPGLEGHGPRQGRVGAPIELPVDRGLLLVEGSPRRRPRLPLDSGFHVVAYDFGIKRNILRMLALTMAAAVTHVVPARDHRHRGRWRWPGRRSSSPTAPATRSPAPTPRRSDPPIPLQREHAGVRHLPRAPDPRPRRSARSTVKMKFGHHGANHPVVEHRDRPGADHLAEPRLRGATKTGGRCRHNVKGPRTRSLFDGSLEGLACTDRAGLQRSSTTPRRARARTTPPLFDGSQRLSRSSARPRAFIDDA